MLSKRASCFQTTRLLAAVVLAAFATTASVCRAQPLGEADREQPGDAQIQAWLARQAEALDGQFLAGIDNKEKFAAQRERLQREYFDMLGLWPLPERTPLKVTVTGTLTAPGCVIDNLHFQSRPGLYVTANLYRPAETKPGEKLPAVLYVCGHASEGRNGGKTAFQSHGLWLARHGYVALLVDTLQLGEIAATHHGTYRYGRWSWHSRGYSPAAVECWNGVRAIDYLVSRTDVDPQRIGVTGMSGGGAATFWITAADDRVRVAVPASGMSDLTSYVANRVINGHCDCMFLHNQYQWPWTQIAALVAPRPLLFVNSDQDNIFPMDGNQRISARLERLYSMLGVPNHFGSFVSQGGHAYRQDIREAVFRFLNTHLKNDPSAVSDTEVDLPDGKKYAIAPERLRVFPTDQDLPADELNTTIDEILVPVAKVELPTTANFASWKRDLREKLDAGPLRLLKERVPVAQPKPGRSETIKRLETEPGIECDLHVIASRPDAKVVRLVVKLDDAALTPAEIAKLTADEQASVYVLEPRGVGESRWTVKNPPNYVARSCVLLGRTVDEGRIRDVIAAARYLRQRVGDGNEIRVVGVGPAAVLAAYAALLEPEIAGLVAVDPLLTHTDDNAPQLLGVLRVCDVPDVFGMLAPKSLTMHTSGSGGKAAQTTTAIERVRQIYAAADADKSLKIENHK